MHILDKIHDTLEKIWAGARTPTRGSMVPTGTTPQIVTKVHGCYPANL